MDDIFWYHLKHCHFTQAKMYIKFLSFHGKFTFSFIQHITVFYITNRYLSNRIYFLVTLLSFLGEMIKMNYENYCYYNVGYFKSTAVKTKTEVV